MTRKITDMATSRERTYKSRRTALQMLGFGGAAAAVAGSEAFSMPPEKPGGLQSVTGAYNKERWAKALENMAAEIRSESVMVSRLNLSSQMDPDSIADKHTLELEFIFKPEV